MYVIKLYNTTLNLRRFEILVVTGAPADSDQDATSKSRSGHKFDQSLYEARNDDNFKVSLLKLTTRRLPTTTHQSKLSTDSTQIDQNYDVSSKIYVICL